MYNVLDVIYFSAYLCLYGIHYLKIYFFLYFLIYYYYDIFRGGRASLLKVLGDKNYVRAT
jgi:hypothetical protein